MSIKDVEMQDDQGNIYYPHTDASLVKYNESTVEEALDAYGTSLSDVAHKTGTVQTDLNADLLDGQHGSYYAPLANPAFSGTPTISGNNILRALYGGYKVQSGFNSGTVVTAGTGVSVNITFPTAFASVPNVNISLTTISVSNAGYINIGAGAVTATGMTIIINSFVAQIVYFSWQALGA